ILFFHHPAGRALKPSRFIDRRQPAQSQECSVDVVAAPATIPRAAEILRLVQESDRSANSGILSRKSEANEGLECATGDVLAARIDHRVVIGEWDEREHFVVALLVERTPTAVAILHRDLPRY